MTNLAEQLDTTRYLILDPALGWKTFPAQHVLATFNGERRLPSYACSTTKFVTAYLRKTADGLEHLWRVDYSEWVFDADGRVDQAKQWADILQKIDPVEQHCSTEHASGETEFSGLSASQIKDIRTALGLAA